MERDAAPPTLREGAAGSGPRLSLAPAADRDPEVIGPYRIVRRLARGGMGIVYRAEHADTGEPVALKTLFARVPAHVEGIRREIHALRRVTHRGVVRILDQGMMDGVPWYAMELVPGTTLSGYVREEACSAPTLSGPASWGRSPPSTRPLPEPRPRAALPEALGLMRRLCETLSFLHAQGIVHRDLKPDNVIVRPDGTPVLVDFGLSSAFSGPGGREVLDLGGDGLGTASYVAPELVLGLAIDARVDLYALGCMLYELVTGRLPFLGSAPAVIAQHLRDTPVAPSKRVHGVSPLLDTLIVRLLAKDPRRRPGYASDVAATLRLFEAAAPEPAPPAPPPYLYRPSFVGRSGLVDDLVELLARVDRGQGQRVYLAGESGVGKTRLALEIARRASRQGFRVITGECIPVVGAATEGAVKASPLHPLRPLLRAVADHCEAGGAEITAQVLGRRGRVLAAHEPALALLPGQSELREAAHLAADAGRARLVADLAETLSAFAEDAPILLVLDDLQWADELTHAWLASLGESFFARARVLLLGLYRSEETTADLRGLLDRTPGNVFKLGRMDEAAINTIASDMLANASPPGDLLRFLAEASEGNPFFVSEYLRAAVGERILSRDEAGAWRMSGQSGAPSEPLPLPRSLRDLVARRLDDLDPLARSLSCAAAVLGREIDPERAAAVAGLTEQERLTATTQLITREVVEEMGGAGLRFSHDKLREAAYARVPDEQRAALHERAATAIETDDRAKPDFPRLYPVLAHHWSLAGRRVEAIEYAARAGEHALERGAHSEAVRWLSSALQWHDEAGLATLPLRRARWLRMLGEASFGMGRLDEASQFSAGALDALGQPVGRSAGEWTAILVRQASKQAARALVGRPPAPDREGALLESARAAGLLASAHYFRGDGLPMTASLLLGVNLAEQAGSTAGVSQSLSRLGYAAGLARLSPLSQACFRRAHALADGEGDASALALSLYLDAFHHLGLGAWSRAEDLARRAGALLREIGDRQDAEVAETIGAHAVYYAGRVRESEVLYRRILESARARSNGQHIGWGLFLVARSLLAMGRNEEALTLLEEAQPHLSPAADRLSVVIAEGLLAEAYRVAGRTSEAETTALALRAKLAGAPLPLAPCLHGYTGVVEVCLSGWEARGDRALREAALATIGATFRFAMMFPMALPAALRAAGRTAVLDGHALSGAWLIRRSAREAQRLGMRLDQAQALSALTSYGVGTEAEDAQARAIFAEIGCEARGRRGRGAGPV